jgi:hypothetical protein
MKDMKGMKDMKKGLSHEGHEGVQARGVGAGSDEGPKASTPLGKAHQCG